MMQTEQTNMVHTWMGRPIKKLSREDLLKVVDYLSLDNQKLLEDRDKWRKSGDPLKYLMLK